MSEMVTLILPLWLFALLIFLASAGISYAVVSILTLWFGLRSPRTPI